MLTKTAKNKPAVQTTCGTHFGPPQKINPPHSFLPNILTHQSE